MSQTASSRVGRHTALDVGVTLQDSLSALLLAPSHQPHLRKCVAQLPERSDLGVYAGHLPKDVVREFEPA